MRELKFRAWDRTKKQMIWSLHESIKDSPVWNSVFWGKVEADPDNYDVMQYTGLKDKNGKDIYEGDIVELEGWSPKKWEVTFDRGGFCMRENADSCYYPDIKYAEKSKVIGNIYESLELLK